MKKDINLEKEIDETIKNFENNKKQVSAFNNKTQNVKFTWFDKLLIILCILIFLFLILSRFIFTFNFYLMPSNNDSISNSQFINEICYGGSCFTLNNTNVVNQEIHKENTIELVDGYNV